MEGTNQYYQVLGLKPGASHEEIVQAYKILTKTWYPQRNSEDKSVQETAREKLKEIEEAYIKLMTPTHTALDQKGSSSASKLEVTSEPTGAKVYVDGREVGETPLILSEINSGQRTIRVLKEGFNPSEGKVEIKPGEQKALNAHLKKIETHGSLLVETRPTGVMVHLDGKPMGTSPCGVGGLTHGSHKLLIIKEGYENWGRTVVIESGKSSIINIDLKALELRTGEFFKDSYLGMEFIFVKGGIFEMGDVFGDGKTDEKPVHEVQIDDFHMGKYEVTQGQWEKVMGTNPSYFSKGDNYPVENVNWAAVEEFISHLNQKTGKRYRLPTEAEWEYAARSGGRKEKWAGTISESELGDFAWYQVNSGGSTHPVGQKKTNGLGLYDMSGNVSEWVYDYYHEPYYRNSPKNNPKNEIWGDEKRVFRGGSCNKMPGTLRTSARACLHPQCLFLFGDSSEYIGFRLVLSAKDASGVVTETRSTKREDTEQSLMEPLVLDLDGINLEPKRYTSPRPTAHKDAGRVDRQPVKPSERGLGIGAKVGLAAIGPSGVGGWLLLLVVGLLVLFPLLNAGRINAEIMAAETQYPTIKSLPQWANLKAGMWWTFLAFAALSFYGGWGLARGKDWSVVKRAKFVLWLIGPVGAFVMGVIVPIATLGKSSAAEGQFWGNLIVSIISASIWTAYLSKSKRVRNTYGPQN